jgi:hypothetical protein
MHSHTVLWRCQWGEELTAVQFTEAGVEGLMNFLMLSSVCFGDYIEHSCLAKNVEDDWK